jgi:hypothetical protein
LVSFGDLWLPLVSFWRPLVSLWLPLVRKTQKNPEKSRKSQNPYHKPIKNKKEKSPKKAFFFIKLKQTIGLRRVYPCLLVILLIIPLVILLVVPLICP